MSINCLYYKYIRDFTLVEAEDVCNEMPSKSGSISDLKSLSFTCSKGLQLFNPHVRASITSSATFGDFG